MELLLAGYTHVQIAQVVNCTRETVSVLSRSPIFLGEYNRRLASQNDKLGHEHKEAFEDKIKIILAQAAPRAADVQVELLESEDDSIRLRASSSILDRAIGKSVDPATSTGTTVNVQINGDRAQLLVSALKESQNDQRTDYATDFLCTDASEGEQGDVHQATDECSRLRYREAEAQDRQEVVLSPRLAHANGRESLPSVSELFSINEVKNQWQILPQSDARLIRSSTL